VCTCDQMRTICTFQGLIVCGQTESKLVMPFFLGVNHEDISALIKVLCSRTKTVSVIHLSEVCISVLEKMM
jgi:hypothetical protein